MGKHFNKAETKNSVKKFEEMLKNGQNLFFDLNTYEAIINHFIDDGKINKALKACSFAFIQYPFSFELLITKAQLLVKKEKLDEALFLLDDAEKFQPNDTEIIFLRGSILSKQGRFAEAVEYLNGSLNFAEEKDQIYYALGITYQEWGKFEIAIENYKKALSLGCSAPLGEVYKAAGISFDFSEKMIKELMEFTWNELEKLY